MGAPRQALCQAGIDASGVGGQRFADIGADDAFLLLGHATEAKAPAHPVKGQGVGTDQLGERPTPHAQQRLELEGPVLRVTEAEPEPGILAARRVDVRNAPSVSADQEAVAEAHDSQPTTHPREPATRRPQEETRPIWSRHVAASLRPAPVYSPS